MTVYRWLERLLLISGLALLAIYIAARVDAEAQFRTRLRGFERASQKAHPRVPGETGHFAPDFRQWSPQRIRAFADSVTLNPEVPLAVLRIPRVRLEVPVVNGTDELSLNRGAGWIAGTAAPGHAGNVGIAGHRDGFFRVLKDVVTGDRLELQTLQGTEVFVVDEIRIVPPSQSSVLQARNRSSVTLVTCYPFYFVGAAPQRYIIRASLQGPSSLPQGIGQYDKDFSYKEPPR